MKMIKTNDVKLFDINRFDESDKMINKYHLNAIYYRFEHTEYSTNNKPGDSGDEIHLGDWLAIDENGHTVCIPNESYEEMTIKLPVIPKAVSDWIETCKDNKLSLLDTLQVNIDEIDRPKNDFFRWMTDNYQLNNYSAKKQDIFAKAWVIGYQVN